MNTQSEKEIKLKDLQCGQKFKFVGRRTVFTVLYSSGGWRSIVEFAVSGIWKLHQADSNITVLKVL